MSDHFSIEYVQRVPGPAQSPPDPRYPEGVDLAGDDRALDLSTPNPRCLVTLPYPGPGRGTWFVSCRRCPRRVAVTCAGRADDPRSVTLTCGGTS